MERLVWRKSSRSSSNGGSCVEVATVPGTVLTRDSKDRDGPRLAFSEADWRAFLGQAKAGAFDRR